MSNISNTVVPQFCAELDGLQSLENVVLMLTSNRPVEDWGKLLGDSAAVTAMLDRLLHHGHVLQCGPRSWRTKTTSREQSQ